MNLFVRSPLAAVAVSAVLCLTAPALGDCPTLPVTGKGAVGRGASKQNIMRVILDELARHTATAGSKDDNQTSFLAAIDYTAYLNVVSFKNDADTTETMRRTLNERFPELGDRFFLFVADTYYHDYPANYYKIKRLDPYVWLSTKVSIGSFYIDELAKKYGAPNPKVRALYELVGTYTLFQVASHVDTELAGHRLDADKLDSTLSTLRQHGVPVGTPKGDLYKAWDYFKRGDIDKLVQRGLDRTFLERYKRLVSDTYSAGSATVDCHISVVDVVGRDLGHVATAYVMDRRSVYATYNARVNGATVAVPTRALLAMSASYTDSDGIPDGFTVLDGNVRNAGLSRRMDALVSIDRGDITVVDLRLGARCGTQPLQPFTSLPDYYCLLRCVTGGRSTLFQTHLLYANGQPALDPATAPVKPGGKVTRRERRILAMTADRFIVVDIPTPCTIAEATFLLQQTLKLVGINTTQVQAAVNLDTGSFDILDVFCPVGRLRNHKKLMSRDATNLLVFAAR